MRLRVDARDTSKARADPLLYPLSLHPREESVGVPTAAYASKAGQLRAATNSANFFQNWSVTYCNDIGCCTGGIVRSADELITLPHLYHPGGAIQRHQPVPLGAKVDRVRDAAHQENSLELLEGDAQKV